MSFERSQVVFAGVDRVFGVRPGDAQRGGERCVLFRIGDLILFAAIHERVDANDYAKAWGSTDASAYNVLMKPGVSPEQGVLR